MVDFEFPFRIGNQFVSLYVRGNVQVCVRETSSCLISRPREGKTHDSSANLSLFFFLFREVDYHKYKFYDLNEKKIKRERGLRSKTSFPTASFQRRVNTSPFTRGNAALTVRVPRMEQIYRSVERLRMPRCFAIGPVISYLFQGYKRSQIQSRIHACLTTENSAKQQQTEIKILNLPLPRRGSKFNIFRLLDPVVDPIFKW